MKTMTKILMSLFLLGSLNIVKAETLLDYDGDGRSDFVVLRRNDPNLDWYIYPSSNGAWYVQPWGLTFNGVTSDEPIPADFDGDGKTDVAVWRRSNQPGQSAFYILNSSNQTLRIDYLGEPGDILNAVGDYDGDGKADPAVYQRSAYGRNYYVYRGSLNNPGGATTRFFWGMGMDYLPYRGDFDGDGKLDFCIRSNNNATFSLKRSTDGGTELIAFGKTNDVLAPGDYDGDGRTDFCVERLGKGYKYNWYILERDGGGTGFLTGIVWGQLSAGFQAQYSGGDFDGDGKADIAFYEYLPDNLFMIRKSSDRTLLQFQWGGGSNADNPIHINYGF